MAVQVTPHPAWVAELDAALDPGRQAILDTPVIVDASENQLVDGQIQNFLVGFYPIIRDFPQWLQMLLDRSPDMGREFFTDNIRVRPRPADLCCALLCSGNPGAGDQQRRRPPRP